MATVSWLILIQHVKACMTGQREKAPEVKTCLCFCLFASSVLREGEEHVT